MMQLSSKNDDSSLCYDVIITHVTPGDRREPPADTKCTPAAQRKQAKRACNALKVSKKEFCNKNRRNKCMQIY